jgi:hypothetical protein
MSKGNVAARREGGAKFTTGWRNSGWREAMARVAAAARENMPRAKKVEKITKEPNGIDRHAMSSYVLQRNYHHSPKFFSASSAAAKSKLHAWHSPCSGNCQPHVAAMGVAAIFVVIFRAPLAVKNIPLRHFGSRKCGFNPPSTAYLFFHTHY